MASTSKTSHIESTETLGWFRGMMTFLFFVSGVINLLALTGSFYMLQIYDRALTSQSVETLVAISVLAIGLYLLQGMLDVARSQILVRLGTKTGQRLAPTAHRVAMDMPRFGYGPVEANERLRDVDTLQQFVSGQGPIALLDLPWMPLYLAFIYMLHPWLAALVVAGALTLGSLTLVTELLTKASSSPSQKASLHRSSIADTNIRNVEVLRSMGSLAYALERFEKANKDHLELQLKTSDVSSTFSGISKVLRMILQSAVLGLGAYFVIKGELSAGSIIAASVSSARALAPIDLAIGQWKGFVAARRSYRRLKETIAALDKAQPAVVLPRPSKTLKVEKLTVAAPGSGTVLLSDVSFEVQAGQAVGIIGHSGSGKSTLARALTGVWPPLRGNIRLDNADIAQWDPDLLGKYIGYLPQDVALMDGTIGEMISRFEPDADSDDIVAAARSAGAHDMIVRLPRGYGTQLGPLGTALSSGQRQRIALARALYKKPFLIVLDEPNSNLDAEGESALADAILKIREAGSIAIVVAHRPSALKYVDLIGVMQTGKLAAFGTKDEVLASQTMNSSASPLKPKIAAVSGV